MKEEIQIGDVFVNKARYKGEGKMIVLEIYPETGNVYRNCVKVMLFEYEKHSGLNGSERIVDFDTLSESYTKEDRETNKVFLFREKGSGYRAAVFAKHKKQALEIIENKTKLKLDDELEFLQAIDDRAFLIFCDFLPF